MSFVMSNWIHSLTSKSDCHKSSNFRFVTCVLYVPGLFLSATHLLASYPYYEIAFMTLWTFYNKKYFIFLKCLQDGLLSFKTRLMVEIDKIQTYSILPSFVIAADAIWLTGLLWVGYLNARRKNGSDEVSGGNQIGSDTFQNGSDIIRYLTVILSPDNYAFYRNTTFSSNWHIFIVTIHLSTNIRNNLNMKY